ncbi:MBL fold metallo-hydrolase [candidate division WOR-3 bacterium 4484_100]|uniref:MBL fold metallo-hydrolase n=1 Tax=candidate division WOR-3 bacterium 4484_100 TaxID=1936077 RepID=A0A1V4QF46_UNCW3|nr:MAG: MBL fold metallo-hydrolase [candidate division WOR-3 bacterium 4484_100]
MKITIIYDNTAFRKDLKSDWGFSAFLEIEERKILFDTGADGRILLSNMEKLEINPKEIDDVFISHPHWDHTGGLSSFLRLNNQVKLWVPSYLSQAEDAREFIELKKPTKLHEGIYSTGELEGIEQSLCVETEKGIVIIAGCSHPRMEHILQVASGFGKVYGIIGGLHGTKPESLKDLNLICATHCTQYKREIEKLYPQKYIEGGAGRVIEI